MRFWSVVLSISFVLAASWSVASVAHGQDKPSPSEKKRVLFVAGKPSHGYGAHEHNAGCTLLAKELQAAMPDYRRATCISTAGRRMRASSTAPTAS